MILQADRRGADADGFRQAEDLRQKDLRHDDVLVARRVMLADPEILKAQLLAPHGQLQVLIQTLGKRLGRVMDRHHEHPQPQRRWPRAFRVAWLSEPGPLLHRILDAACHAWIPYYPRPSATRDQLLQFAG
jgi:hypothetical protein